MSKTILYAAKLSEPYWEYADKYVAFLYSHHAKKQRKVAIRTLNGQEGLTTMEAKDFGMRSNSPHNSIKNRLPTGIKGIFVGVSGITYDIYIQKKGQSCHQQT